MAQYDYRQPVFSRKREATLYLKVKRLDLLLEVSAALKMNGTLGLFLNQSFY